MTTTMSATAPVIAVRAALRALDATRALADATLEPVPGGFSNHAWKAEQGGCSWFVRLGGPDSATLGVDRRSECALLGAVAPAGLAPPQLACDPSNGLLVTRFVEGATWRRADARDVRNVARIAESLRVLHGLEPSAAVRRIDFAAQARRLETELRAMGPGSIPSCGKPSAIEVAVRTARELCPVLARVVAPAIRLLLDRCPMPVPCHNDLHHLNLIDDGRTLWIVDWEYGGIGDPLFDLASFACQHEFTAAERVVLLDACGYGGGNALAALDAACTVFDYVQWLWYVLWAVRNPAAGDECAERACVLAGRLAAATS